MPIRLGSTFHSAARADRADCPLGIVQGRRVLIAAAVMTVVENECRHADGIQPLGHVRAFVLNRHMAIAAARTDDHRGAGRRARVRQEDGERRLVFRTVTLGAWGPIGPKKFGFRFGGSSGTSHGRRKNDRPHETVIEILHDPSSFFGANHRKTDWQSVPPPSKTDWQSVLRPSKTDWQSVPPPSKTDWQSVLPPSKTDWQSVPRPSKTDWQSVPQPTALVVALHLMKKTLPHQPPRRRS